MPMETRTWWNFFLTATIASQKWHKNALVGEITFDEKDFFLHEAGSSDFSEAKGTLFDYYTFTEVQLEQNYILPNPVSCSHSGQSEVYGKPTNRRVQVHTPSWLGYSAASAWNLPNIEK